MSNMEGEKEGDMGRFGWVRRGEKCSGQFYPLLFEAAKELDDTLRVTLPTNDEVQLDMAQFESWMEGLATLGKIDDVRSRI